MLALCSTIADRLLEMFVPKTTAGACPCNDNYCTSIRCFADSSGWCNDPFVCFWHVFTNCNCEILQRTCNTS
jgi:hypothetical protein